MLNTRCSFCRRRVYTGTRIPCLTERASALSLYIPARSTHDSVPASLNTSAGTTPSYAFHDNIPPTAFSTTPFAECVVALSQTQSDTHPLTDGCSVSISEDGDTVTLNGDPTLTYPLHAGSLPTLAEQTPIHRAIDNLVTAREYASGKPGFDATLTRAIETADRHLHVTVESRFGTHTFSIQLEQTPPSPAMTHLMEQLAGFSPQSSSLAEPVRLLFFGAHHPPPSQCAPLGPDTDDRWVFLPRETATCWDEQIPADTHYGLSFSRGGLAALGSALASVVALTVGLLGLPVSASTPRGQLLVVSARLSIVLLALFLAGVLARTVGAEWASA